MHSAIMKSMRRRVCCLMIALTMVLCDVPAYVYATETNGTVDSEFSEDEVDNRETIETTTADENGEVDREVASTEDTSDRTEVETISETDTEEVTTIATEEVTTEETIEELELCAAGSGIDNDIEWKVEYAEGMQTRILTIKPAGGKTEVRISSAAKYPWDDYKDSISKVVVADGIKNIPSNCFYDYRKLSEVELADSIEEIGRRAFFQCTCINNIDLPAGLKTIGEYAFENCYGIEEYRIPTNTEKISKGAFSNNAALKYIHIPASVTKIDEKFYENYSMAKNRWDLVIEVDSSNKNYSVTDGILYEDATGMALLCGKPTVPISDIGVATITLRPGTKRIAAKAFGDMCFQRHFIRLYMPDSVTEIGEEAFLNSYLSAIELSQNMEKIGTRAFAYCTYLPGIEFPDSVTTVGEELFLESSMYTASFPKNMKVIPDGMYRSAKLSRVFVPSGIEVIGADAFAGNRSQYAIEEVSIPKSVQVIKERAFAGNHIKDVYYGGTEEEWTALKDSQMDLSWLSEATVHYYTDSVELTFNDGILLPGGKLKSGITFGEIGVKAHPAVKTVRFTDWVNKYGASMKSTDTVAQSNEYFAYVSIITDSYFNNGTIVTLNGEECEVFDISADGKRISFVTPSYSSECTHSRVDFGRYEYDGEKHWYNCPDCDDRVRENAHKFDSGVLVAGVTTYTCSICNYEKKLENGRMRMNRTQLSGGYYEVGNAIPIEFTMDENYAYSSCYELSELKWYKGAYSESNRIDVKHGQYFENDTYYVEFEIAIKENLVDQYYLKAGGINVRFVQNGLAEEETYRVVREDPNISGRQIQKMVFSYEPLDRNDLTVVLPSFSNSLTVDKFLNNIKFYAGEQVTAPVVKPTVKNSEEVLAGSASILSNTPYKIIVMLDAPGYIDEKSIKGSGIMGCDPGAFFNYKKAENKTGVMATIEFCYNPKGIVVANIDVEAPIAGEKLGNAAVAREFDLFEVKNITWYDENSAQVDSDSIAQIGDSYIAVVTVAPKGQNIFTNATIYTVNGYDVTIVNPADDGGKKITYRFPTVEEHIHTVTLIPIDYGNCSRAGHVEYYQCSECGRSYLDRELTKRITNLNTWLTTDNNGLLGGKIQDTSIHNFSAGQNGDLETENCLDCGIKNINYHELKVNVGNAQYTGSLIDAPITIDGLTFGADYYISDGAYGELPGVYEAVIVGRNGYGGQRKVEWIITANGMWIALDSHSGEYEYTGTPIKPVAIVYDGTRRLTVGKDYTIAYKNNTNAYTLKPKDVGFDANKAPTIIVTGKGDYSGKETANFVINPKSISGITVDDIYVNETGRPIAVKPVVKAGNKTLVYNKDYRIYSTINPDEIVENVTACDTYRLEVRGIGNYKGATWFNFDVSNKILINKCSITVKNAEYDDGRIVKPEVIVKYKGQTVDFGTGYTLELKDREVGNATVKIIGKDAYTGYAVKSFKITGLPISSAKLDSIPELEYTGSNVIPSIKLTYEKRGTNPVTLRQDKDYVYTISNNVKVGTAKIVFTGKGRYTGSKTVNYKIKPYNVEKVASKIVINDNNPVDTLYVAGGAKPEVPVTFGGIVLTKGVDYTCTYSNNTKVASASDSNAPTITFTFKGNYKGKLKQTFSIGKVPITDMSVTLPDIVYNPRANGWISMPVIKDANGKSLVEGKDYKITYYSDYAHTTLADDSVNAPGNTVYADIDGLDSYISSKPVFYNIRLGNISTAQISVDNIEFNAEGIVTLKKSNIKIKCNGRDLQDSDYSLASVQWPDGPKIGTGKVLIEGRGEYIGEKAVNFKVVPRNTSTGNENNVTVIKNSTGLYYKKSGAKMGIKVVYNGLNQKQLKEGVDYTVSYININKAASASDVKAPTIIVNFKGNYKGRQEIKYDINKQPLAYGDIYNADIIYNNKPDGWKQTRFTFKDVDKNLLKAGVDYDIAPGYYKDSACTQPFTDLNNIAGNSVYVKFVAKPDSNYQGEWTRSYKIITGDIAKATVTVKNTKNWTGSSINLDASDIEVKFKGSSTPLVAGRDWEIVVCRNNINRGTATVEIRGVGDYGGTKTATFRIVQKPFRWWNR